MAGQVSVEHLEQVAFVSLSHPSRLNAMSRGMWRALREVFTGLQRTPGVRCIVVRGEGAAFCAGGDISEYPAFRFDEQALRAFHEDDVWGGLSAMLACDVPIVAQIDGACMGAGVEIASCCDIRIAGTSATFGAPIARLGFPMAPRELALVARAAGEPSAREMLLEAAVFDAAEMKARGFLNRVVPDAEVAAQAQQSARRIAALAPQAARMNKQLLRGIYEPKVPGRQSGSAQDAINSIADASAGPYAYADSAEHREGIAAFLEKRKPSF